MMGYSGDYITDKYNTSNHQQPFSQLEYARDQEAAARAEENAWNEAKLALKMKREQQQMIANKLYKNMDTKVRTKYIPSLNVRSSIKQNLSYSKKPPVVDILLQDNTGGKRRKRKTRKNKSNKYKIYTRNRKYKKRKLTIKKT